MNVPAKPLDKQVRIGVASARLYHKEQPKVRRTMACTRCLQEGHWTSDCGNDIACRECGQSGHRRGDPDCDAVPAGDPPLTSDDVGVATDCGTEETASDEDEREEPQSQSQEEKESASLADSIHDSSQKKTV